MEKSKVNEKLSLGGFECQLTVGSKTKEQVAWHFFERLKDFKLNDVYELSGKVDFVQTLRHNKSAIPWQNDYFFISDTLKNNYQSYKIIDNEKVRRYSDHNIVLIEMELDE